MKSYTDLEQSKKLAEILPLESADMEWINNDGLGEPFPFVGRTNDEERLPCQSLAALLEILKYPSLTQDVEHKWFITDWTGAYPKSEYDFDSPVDACYRMILKLHELKLL